jgi:hypothetical protein
VAGEFTDGLTGRAYPIVGTVPVVAAPSRAAAAASTSASTSTSTSTSDTQ